MSDPHPLHTQPLAPRFVDTKQVEYFAVYPDGRRLEVDYRSALRNADAWRKEGVEVVTRVTPKSWRVIGELEGLLPNVPRRFGG